MRSSEPQASAPGIRPTAHGGRPALRPSHFQIQAAHLRHVADRPRISTRWDFVSDVAWADRHVPVVDGDEGPVDLSDAPELEGRRHAYNPASRSRSAAV